jgi:hypothetical protein
VSCGGNASSVPACHLPAKIDRLIDWGIDADIETIINLIKTICMRNIFKNRRIKLYGLSVIRMSIIFAGVFMQSCSGDMRDNALLDDFYVDSNFSSFENEFAKSLSSNKDMVNLIGFRTYNISEDEKQSFKDLVSGYGDEMRKINHIVADDYSCFAGSDCGIAVSRGYCWNEE